MEDAERLGAIWLHAAEAEQDAVQLLWAHNALMHVAAALGKPEDVLLHGEAVLDLDPANVATLKVARTLLGQGDTEAALARVNTFVSTTSNPAHLEEAKQLRAEIAAKQGGNGRLDGGR